MDKFEKLPVGEYAVGLIAKMNDYEFRIIKFNGYNGEEARRSKDDNIFTGPYRSPLPFRRRIN